MKEWLDSIIEHTSMVIDGMAVVIIAIGTVEVFFTSLRDIFRPSTTGHELRDGYLRYARWLVAGLTVQLAADIIDTARGASWNEIGQLAAIAAIRTILDYFLERDIAEARERQKEAEKAKLNASAV
jgi:uncharacterized membrane protein